MTHGLFEVTNLPYTTVPIVDETLHTRTAQDGGA